MEKSGGWAERGFHFFKSLDLADLVTLILVNSGLCPEFLNRTVNPRGFEQLLKTRVCACAQTPVLNVSAESKPLQA